MIGMQFDLFGGLVPADVVEGIKFILETDPSARNDYRRMMARFWLEFEGLDEVLGDKAGAFVDWFTQQATPPKTLQNRCMEIQNQHRDLEADPHVKEYRRRQATAGRVR